MRQRDEEWRHMAWPDRKNLPLWPSALLAGWRYPAARSALFRDPMLLTSASATGVIIAVAIPVATENAGCWGR